MSETTGNPGSGVSRSRFAPILAWVLFLRFPLLVGLLFLAFPFLAIGPLSALLANLFRLGFADLFGVTLLALLVGRSLVLATATASWSGPIRLLPARDVGEGAPAGAFPEPLAAGVRLAWSPDGRLARALGRWDERVAVALALPTIAVAFALSRAAPEQWIETWTIRKLIAVALGVVAYLLLRGGTKLFESWFGRPPATVAASAEERTVRASAFGRLETSLRRREPPRIAKLFRRLAVRFFLLPSFRIGYLREQSSDETLAEITSRRAAGESEERLRRVDDPTLRFDLLPGHGAAIGFFTLTFTTYLALGVVNHPGWFRPWFPTLGYVLLLFLGIGWGLAALSFWFDRFRVPVLLLLLVVSVLATRLGGGDHYFELLVEPEEVSREGTVTPETAPPPAPAASPADEQRLFATLLERCDRPVVAVAAAGGGITSSAWTAAVLTRLAESPSGGELLDSLFVVSGVSGGSVGAMFFLDGVAAHAGKSLPLSPVSPLSTAAGERIRKDASASSLDAVGWGLAYPDLARVLFSPLVELAFPTVDRSWALERSWEVRLLAAARDRGEFEPLTPTLGSWREATLAGELPVAILNATAVESGERFQLATIALTPGLGRSDFLAAYAGHDIAIPTAARLSATFPFVSTAARAWAGRDANGRVPGAHFVDGGYYDNSGLLSALELLDRALGALHDSASCRPPVAIVRLEPFDATAPTLEEVTPASGWKSAAVSPVKALLEVRTSTQVYRNNWEAGIFAEKWRGRGFEIHEIRFQLDAQGPLSWKLSEEEITHITAEAVEEMGQPDALRLFALLEGHNRALPAAETATADAAARSELGPMKAP